MIRENPGLPGVVADTVTFLPVTALMGPVAASVPLNPRVRLENLTTRLVLAAAMPVHQEPAAVTTTAEALVEDDRL